MGAIRFIRQSLMPVLWSWWNVDRIRVSPQEGRLLKLQEGQVIHIRGEQYRVNSREVVCDRSRTRVRFMLIAEECAATLCVLRDANGEVRGELLYRGDTSTVYDDDITVLLRPDIS